ncbi:hypothetical protein ISN44_As03g040020 [Arabidopsis suecica]|uniref:Uncharacterized protein n=1 Tax=Arabidopsis suecica TaxID=45249 RepID=A0A8T2FGQ2_ARASU|nr:hypothetical protein ISN44_As03g040020 [Arabidopsis suecica]
MLCIDSSRDLIYGVVKVMEFQKGNQNFVCLNKQVCAIRTPSCKGRGGSVGCSLGIQLAFSGTDKHLAVLNSWYEVENLKQYSLYGLYSNLKSSLTNQLNNFF